MGSVPELPPVIGVRLGTMSGSRENDLAFLESLAERGESLGSPSLFVHTLSTAALADVSLALGCRGGLSTVSNGEASGLLAVALGAGALAAGRSTACLCGAMDVCGSDSDVIALFLLEPARSDIAVPRLSGWELTFDTSSPPRSGSLRSSMERLVLALCSDDGGTVSASSGTGESVRLSVVPAGRSGRPVLFNGDRAWLDHPVNAPVPTDSSTEDALRTLREELKQLLVTTLRLENVRPEDIGDTEPLFSSEARLGLDSLAALELLSAVEFTYKVRFGDEGSAREHFESISTLAAFVASARA
ncbi:MAG: beta-ketoacyl synthase N-terminal-like domain-containing protein [Myxococcaceae bacterium]